MKGTKTISSIKLKNLPSFLITSTEAPINLSSFLHLCFESNHPSLLAYQLDFAVNFKTTLSHSLSLIFLCYFYPPINAFISHPIFHILLPLNFNLFFSSDRQMEIVLILKSIHDVCKATKKPNTQNQATAPYEESNQSTKSNSDMEPSPIYSLTQSQKRYKKELLIVWFKLSQFL